MTDFIAEAREAAKRIPDPKPSNVVPFGRRPTQTRVSTPAPRRPDPPHAA